MSEKTEYELIIDISTTVKHLLEYTTEPNKKKIIEMLNSDVVKLFDLLMLKDTPSPALQDAVLFKGKTIANGTTVYGTYHYSNDKKHHYILSRENFIETDGRQTLHNKEVSEVVSESIRQINSIKNDLLLQDAAKEKSYTIDEIRKYLLSQDSFGDVMYNLNEESFDEANK